MKARFFLLPLFGICLSGCFSLKSDLPPVSYYDLDFAKPLQQKRCQKSVLLAIADVKASPLYNTSTLIVKKENGEIENISGFAWVDFPKNMIKKLIIKTFDYQCIQAITSPFGGIKYDILLKTELLNFEVIQAQGQSYVQVALLYELSKTKNFSVLKSGIIEKRLKISSKEYAKSFESAIQQILQELFVAMQNLLK